MISEGSPLQPAPEPIDPPYEIAQGVAHGTSGVGGEVAFGRIEKPGSVGECLLGCQLDLGMGQAGDVGELPGDFGLKGGVRLPMLPYLCEPIRSAVGETSLRNPAISGQSAGEAFRRAKTRCNPALKCQQPRASSPPGHGRTHISSTSRIPRLHSP